MTIGENLKSLRKSRGFTQAEIASELHLSRTSYTKYENDVHMPNAEQIQILASIFKVSPAEILAPNSPVDSETNTKQTTAKSAARSDIEKLLGVYNSLDDQSKTQLMSVAYLLAANNLAKEGVDVNQFVEQQLHKIHNKGGEEDEG